MGILQAGRPGPVLPYRARSILKIFQSKDKLTEVKFGFHGLRRL
jgi:hypothetical protein